MSSFPVHIGDGVFILSDATKLRGKQKAIAKEEELQQAAGSTVKPMPKKYKGPYCPRKGCGSGRLRALRSSGTEAAESHEPTHRKAHGVKILPALYVCTECGKRFEA